MQQAQRKRRALGPVTLWMALLLVAREQHLTMPTFLRTLQLNLLECHSWTVNQESRTQVATPLPEPEKNTVIAVTNPNSCTTGICDIKRH